MFSNQNGLFGEAKQAKVLPNIITSLLWVFLFLMVGQGIGGILAHFTKKIIGNDPAVLLLNELICGFIFITLLVFARVKFREKRSISSIGLKKEGLIKKYLVGFGIGILMFSVVVLLLSISGHTVVNSNPGGLSGIAALSGVLIVIPGWIIQSGTEEILSRGWLMNVLGARYNVAVGLIISSSFFGLMHFANPNVNILAIINIVLVGLFFGVYVIKTNDLWGACGLHAAWNWTQGNVFGFEVSGQKVAAGSLLNLRLTGSEWFTGGLFGPEAGIAATIVLCIGIVIVYFIPCHKNLGTVRSLM
ncbi:CPBP family intramembrane metalloprotease [Clostridium estertheticum]|uniref:CPBP family intramembrane glutamic endopeptidase n=1 Tax=Clostridium estertheticum TaxID=238834 RepID=UPI0013E9006B|nr:type II CAAX endopeptidase family protein [Clostridium estertheticum]MBZ9685526.1 CPBP family intramembrane metalloprotease [Clostridium estertheticum]